MSEFTICSPLAEELPNAITEKIIRGAFVEFGALTENNSIDNFQSSNEMALSIDTSGQLVLKESKPSRKITTIHGWTNAFFIFCAVYLRAHPNKAQELLKYGHIIRTAASRFKGWGWRDYDIQFRLRQQRHPENSWAMIDGELWTLYVAVPSSFNFNQDSFRGPGKTNNQQNNTRSTTSNAQSQSSNNPNKSGSRKGLCYNYNKGTCNKPNATCRFKHVCSSCQKEGHGANKCTKR